MQLLMLVERSRAVGSTRARSAKVELLAATLRELDAHERAIGLAYLAGTPRQQRLNVGPGTVHAQRPPPVAQPTLTLTETDATLQEIADVPGGTGSVGRRADLLEGLLARATAPEQDWLRRLVRRELRQGALEGLLIPAIAAASAADEDRVRRAAMLLGDVRAAGELALTGGDDALADVRLRVGTPLAPMLASTATDATEALAGWDEAIVDTKLDGARVQLHRDGTDVAVFTRSLQDVTHRVPELVDRARQLPVSSIVLDGEALRFDVRGRPLPFQESMSRFGREHGEDAGDTDPLVVRWFDLLHLDGHDLLDGSLRTRLDALDATVAEADRARRITANTAQDVGAFLAEVLAAGHEGVIVKDPDGSYEAGRRGAAWRKVKPVHTADLVVLAAEWGSGRRRGWLSNLHLGARADDGEGFIMLGKTFKGLTDEVLTWQTTALLERETHRDRHVVHVRPELVVEIAFDGLVRSTRYPGGVALRFARVRRYRADKTAAQADTLEQVRLAAIASSTP